MGCEEKIKIKKAYFHGRHVDLMWYGRKGIRMKIKGDYESILCNTRKYYDYRLDMVRKNILGEKCVFDIRNEKNIETSCILLIVMEND
jgi:hypothetical protein